jgi:hypothetical protein
MTHRLHAAVALLAWALCQEFLLSESLPSGQPRMWIHHVRALGVYEEECECRVRLKDELKRSGTSWGWRYRVFGLADPARQVRAICYSTGDHPCRADQAPPRSP